MSNYSFSVTPAHIDEWYDENRWWVNDLEYKHLVYLCGMFYVYQRSEQMKNPQLKIQEPAERQMFVDHLKSKFTFSKQTSTSSLSLDKSTIDYDDNDTVDISPLNALKIHPFFHKGDELFNDITKKGPTLEKVCNVNTGKTHTRAAFNKVLLDIRKTGTGVATASKTLDETVDKTVAKTLDKIGTATDVVISTVKTVAPTLIKDLISKWQTSRRQIGREQKEEDMIALCTKLGLLKVKELFDYITKMKREIDRPKLKKAYYLYVQTKYPDSSIDSLSEGELKVLFDTYDTTLYTDELKLIDDVPNNTETSFFVKLIMVMEKLVIYNDIKLIAEFAIGATIPQQKQYVNDIYEVKIHVQPNDQYDDDLFTAMKMDESILRKEQNIDVYKKLHLFWGVSRDLAFEADTKYESYDKSDDDETNKTMAKKIVSYIRVYFRNILYCIRDKENANTNEVYIKYYEEAMIKLEVFEKLPEHVEKYSNVIKHNEITKDNLLEAARDHIVTYYRKCLAEYTDYNHTIIPRGLRFMFEIMYNANRLHYNPKATFPNMNHFLVINLLPREEVLYQNVTKTPSSFLYYMNYQNVYYKSFVANVPEYKTDQLIALDMDNEQYLQFSYKDYKVFDYNKGFDSFYNICQSYVSNITLLRSTLKPFFTCLMSDILYETHYVKTVNASCDYKRFAKTDSNDTFVNLLYNVAKYKRKDTTTVMMKSELETIKNWPSIEYKKPKTRANKQPPLKTHKDGAGWRDFTNLYLNASQKPQRLSLWFNNYLPTDDYEKASTINLIKERDNTIITNVDTIADYTKISGPYKLITVAFPEPERPISIPIFKERYPILDLARKLDAYFSPVVTGTTDNPGPELPGTTLNPGPNLPEIDKSLLPKLRKTPCQSNWRWIVLGLVAAAGTSWWFGGPTPQSMFPYAGQQLSSPPVTITTKTVLCHDDLATISPHANDIQRDYSSIIKQLEDELKNAQSIQTFIKVKENLETYNKDSIKLDDNLYITNQKRIDDFIKKYFAKRHDIDDYNVLINSLNREIPPVIPLPKDIQSKIDNVKKEQESFNTSWAALIKKAKSNTTCMDKETLFKEYGELLTCPSTTTDGGCGCMMMDRPDGGGRRSPKKNAGVMITGRTRSGRLIKAPKQFLQQQWVSESKRSRKRVTTTRSRSRKRINNKKAGKKTSPKQQQAADGNSLLMVQTPVIPFNSCKVFKNI